MLKLANIDKYLRGVNLDIRQLGSIRLIDQKVTPDIVMAVSEVILKYSGGSFTVRDLWESPRFSDVVTSFFVKRDASDPQAKNEYNKFIGQPLNFLAYAKILKPVSGVGEKPKIFKIVQDQWLSYLSETESNSVDFLWRYIERMLKCSGISEQFDSYYLHPDAESFALAREAFARLVHKYTNVKKDFEVRRILPKVMNVPAYRRRTHGVILGRASNRGITLYDIRYNRPNWISAAKLQRVAHSSSPNLRTRLYRVTQAKKGVKAYHSNTPELHDSFMSRNVRVQAHRIFPQHAYPDFADVRENIILLTPDQHDMAHNRHQGDAMSKSYQLYLLLTKLTSIVNSECKSDDAFYSLESFVKMLVALGIIDPRLYERMTAALRQQYDSDDARMNVVYVAANDIRRILVAYYLKDAANVKNLNNNGS